MDKNEGQVEEMSKIKVDEGLNHPGGNSYSVIILTPTLVVSGETPHRQDVGDHFSTLHSVFGFVP